MIDKSEKFTGLVRLGFAARGIVYLLIGYLALSSVGGQKGPQGAFKWLQDEPLGAPILYLSALGLLAYGIFRLGSLVFDIENYGDDSKGIAHRVGHGASALAHFVLAWTAFQFAHGDKQVATGGNANEAAGSLLSFAFGPVVLGLIGLGLFAAAAFQAKAAATGSFMRHISGDAPSFVEPMGRAGHAARAVVFLIIAWSLIQSAWFASSGKIKTLGDAVTSLAGIGPLYSAVAIGLLLFGAFSLVVSRYQIVPDIKRSDLHAKLPTI
ncbi:MAG: DUF1206 domain-containing protein [Croceibacterium sp.]